MTQQELELPKGWAETEFKKTVKSIPLTGKKLKQKEYLQSGKFPVIDQGQDFISGFTDKKVSSTFIFIPKRCENHLVE